MKNYKALQALFPMSKSCAVSSFPDKIDGKILNYTATITSAEQINEIIVTFSEQNPLAPKVDPDDITNWKHQIQVDENGQKLFEQDEAGAVTKIPYRRWEPIQLAHNRKTNMGHVKTLLSRFARAGYKSSLRKIVIGSNGNVLDGQHTLLALWYLFNNYQVDVVDISIEINAKDDPQELFRLFDQAMRKRTLKDALTYSDAYEGWEAEIAGCLRFVTLLSAGRDINQSRLSLPHIVDEKGKQVPLQADDIAGLIVPGECFEYAQEDLGALLSLISVFSQENGDEEEVSLLAHPALTGPGLPNAQYWMTAFLNAKYSSVLSDFTITKFEKFLEDCIKGSDSKSPAVRKLMSYRPTKAVQWLAAIEYCLLCWVNKEEPKRMPQVLTFNGIQAQYDEFTNSEPIETSEEDEDSEEASEEE